jgi:glucose-1-phosphate thymidylyltransferase
MRGIILAGGTGSRLWPLTRGVSKQLLPIYDKPMIYYPLSTLMLAGIREILIITTPGDQVSFVNLLGDGSQIGIDIQYLIQEKPEGIAQAFTLGSDFIGGESVMLILGDNIFHGAGLGNNLKSLIDPNGALIFGYRVSEPQNYGVVEVNSDNRVMSIEEKPTEPKSNLAIPGLYFCDNTVIQRAKIQNKSARGEIEITGVLNSYLKDEKLKLITLPRGTAWLDCGTVDSLQDASNYIAAIEQRQGFKVGCIEEVAWRNGWISDHQLQTLAMPLKGNQYGQYLQSLPDDN